MSGPGWFHRRKSRRPQSGWGTDGPGEALARAVVIGVVVPVFFSMAPELQSIPAFLWLCGAGALIGAQVYCGTRSQPYVKKNAGPSYLMGPFMRLNPAHFHEPGKEFVRWQRRLLPVTALWWLGGGALVMSLR